jgi:hypothetical protein
LEILKNESPRGKPRVIRNKEQFPDRRLVRKKIYYTIRFNAKFPKALRCSRRGKLEPKVRRGIKPEKTVSSE